MGEYLVRFGASLVVAGFLLTSHASMARSGEVPGIAGIRLGMTARSILGLLKAKNIAAQTIFKPCLSDYFALHKSIVGDSGPAHCPEEVEASLAGGTLLAALTEDVPRRPGVMIATDIALNFLR